MTSTVATTALPPIKIQELNPYFERFEREREVKQLQEDDYYMFKIPVRLLDLIKSSLQPGLPELEVIESNLDRRYEDDVEIPGFSHNEQKNREELEKLAFELTKCPELKYIQKKDVKRHIVEYLAKKKRKRKSSKKNKSSDAKKPCYNNRDVQPKSENRKSCQKPPPGLYGAPRDVQAMVFTEEQNHNHDSRLVVSKRSYPPNMCMNIRSGSSVADIVTPGPNMNSLDYSFVDAIGSLDGEGCDDFDKATELTNMQQQAFQQQQQQQQHQQQQQPQNDCQEFVMDFQQQAKEFPTFQQQQPQQQQMDDFMSSFQQQQMAHHMESENKNAITGINFTATAQFNLQATATTNAIDFLNNPFGMQQSSNMMFDQAEQEMVGTVALTKDTIIADRRTVPPQLAQQMWGLFKS